MSKIPLRLPSRQREPSGWGNPSQSHQWFSALGISTPGYITQNEGHDVQGWGFVLGGNTAFSVSLNAVCPPVQWAIWHLYFWAMPGDWINICTSAFGICGSSVLSMGWSPWWLCEGRVWIRWGSGRTRKPVQTSLSTELHARTELLCLLFLSCYDDCWFHTFTFIYL